MPSDDVVIRAAVATGCVISIYVDISSPVTEPGLGLAD
jgi:hypothetical protein